MAVAETATAQGKRGKRRGGRSSRTRYGDVRRNPRKFRCKPPQAWFLVTETLPLLFPVQVSAV